MSYDVDALRAKEFPWTLKGDGVFLDNAKTGALAGACDPRRDGFVAAI